MYEHFDMLTPEEIAKEDTNIGRDFPVIKVGEEIEIGDQGLKKKLLKEGEGSEAPVTGDEVQVHYDASFLDGKEFFSSRDRAPYKFTLGYDLVIVGWHLGIKTMKKGERALFTIPHELAYGASGSLPTVPPKTDLQYEIELLSWVSEKDICKDGGIFKTILVKGGKWEHPRDLDEVLVKYEARLDNGTLVGKSDGIKFIVEEGHFCPALSKAIKTMRKGEKVVLTVKPQYGFGELGKPATGDDSAVPSNATLNIALELVSWNTVTEVTDDKKVVYKILKEGEGFDRPNDGSVVKVKLIGKLQDGTVFLKKGHDEGEEPFEFKTDADQVIEGVDKAVMKMRKGEVALVTIAPEYAFGSSDCPHELALVPSESTVYYEIELVSFKRAKDSWKMDASEKIEAAGKKKEEGNALYKAGKFAKASNRYEKAVDFIDFDSSFSNEEKAQSRDLKIACNLNNAACKLKLNDYKEAKKSCLKVLKADSRNVKGLYRRAQAYVGLAAFDLAESDIKKALEIDPENRDVKLEYKKLKEKMKELKKNDAKLYSNMFGKADKVSS